MDASSTQDHPRLPKIVLALRLCSENARAIKTYGFQLVFQLSSTQDCPILPKIALALRLCSENARPTKTYGFIMVLPLVAVDTI